ncbi:MAG: hypothetical protein IJL71_05350, partial [Oscillospiraceae bacterium]|nr:hypothetical protein [Oscillospiraceae bacterium]
MKMDKKIVIIGTGGLGSAIAEKLLEDGCLVTGVDRLEPDDERIANVIGKEGFTYIKYDLNDI